MLCRAVGATTCGSGNEQLTYDPLGQLIAWQNASGSSEQYAYDGSGQRVWQQASSTSGGTTTTTDTTYVLGVEEVTTTSVTGQQPTTSTTSYYGLPGGLSASRDSSGLTVQATDMLGTPIAALNLATGLVGEQLRTPYGQERFAASAPTAGGMHTTYGFTGQREDTQAPGSSGLDYFNARYYDPAVGRFTSADATMPDLGSPWGTDAYGYVHGQVESATDPSGLELVINQMMGPGANAGPETLEDLDQPMGPFNNMRGGPDGAPLGSPPITLENAAGGTFQLTPSGIEWEMYLGNIEAAMQLSSFAGTAGEAITAVRNSTLAQTYARVEPSRPPNYQAPAVNGLQMHHKPGQQPPPPPTQPGGGGQPPISNRPTQLGSCGCGDSPFGPNTFVYRVNKGNPDEGLTRDQVVQKILATQQILATAAAYGEGVWSWHLGPGSYRGRPWPNNPLDPDEIVYTTDAPYEVNGAGLASTLNGINAEAVLFRMPAGEYLPIQIVAKPGEKWC